MYIVNFLKAIDSPITLDQDWSATPTREGLIVGLNSKYDRLLGLRVQKCYTLPASFAEKLEEKMVAYELIEKLQEGEDLVVIKEEYQYEVGESSGLPTKQGKDVFFAHLDGTFDDMPNVELPGAIVEATEAEAILVGRRGDLVTYYQGRAAELGLVDETKADKPFLTDEFFKQYYQQIRSYIDYGDRSIIDLVQNNTEQAWLDDVPIPLDQGTALLGHLAGGGTGGDFEYDKESPPQTTIREALTQGFAAALSFPSQDLINLYLSVIN